jgi:hypothetical protein
MRPLPERTQTPSRRGQVLRKLCRAFAVNRALTILGVAMLITFAAPLVGISWITA